MGYWGFLAALVVAKTIRAWRSAYIYITSVYKYVFKLRAYISKTMNSANVCIICLIIYNCYMN